MAYRVCFVCLGNICRSPMAASVMRSLVEDAGLGEEISVSSAGTGDWHLGESADPRALAALRRRGYNGAAHRARQFAASWFADHDLMLALDRSNLAALRRLARDDHQRHALRLLRESDPLAGSDLEVPDPYYGGPEGFDEVLDIVERSCRGLLAQLQDGFPIAPKPPG